jgi:endo-1,4-beta-xylanase
MLITLLLFNFQVIFAQNKSGLAANHDKFLGCCHSPGMYKADEFLNYWNQITPENGGKWGSVEKSRDNMNWSNLDAAYNIAQNNNLVFKHHVLVWGSQQPAWMAELDSSEQRQEIIEWFQAVAERYPKIDQIEVVNEALHAPPDDAHEGKYIKALGGSGVTGWDWILEAFRMADTIFSDSVELLINDYSIMNNTKNTDKHLEIVRLLQAEDLIDGIGFQAHGFSHGATNETILRNMDTLASTGLPLYITELEVHGNTDLEQVHGYMNLFPLFWEHPAVKGVTLWGYTTAMWKASKGAYLVFEGEERPALKWLRAYLNDSFVPNESITISSVSGDTLILEKGGKLQFQAEVSPDTSTLQTVFWEVSPTNLAMISQSGLLTAKSEGTVSVTATSLELGSEVSSNTIEVTIEVPSNVNSSTYDQRVKIYPNPSSDGNFTFDGIAGIKKIAFYDLNGIEILVKNVNNLSSVNMQLDVPEGLYIVMLTDGVQFIYDKVSIK